MSPVLIIILTLILVTAAYAGFRAAPWFPTKSKDVQRAVVLAEIKPGMKIYDLGCGDGRVLSAMAKHGAEAIGFEVSLFPYILGQLRLFFDKKINAKIKFADFWNADLNDADVVYFFLMTKIFPKLKIKLEKELKKGTKVISYVWPIDGWMPVKKDEVPGRLPLYLYEII